MCATAATLPPSRVDLFTNIYIQVLCKNFPCEFVNYLNYCRSLRFEDRPDYSYLRRSLKDLFFREAFQYDFVFDWTILNYHANTDSSGTAQPAATGTRAPDQSARARQGQQA